MNQTFVLIEVNFVGKINSTNLALILKFEMYGIHMNLQFTLRRKTFVTYWTRFATRSTRWCIWRRERRHRDFSVGALVTSMIPLFMSIKSVAKRKKLETHLTLISEAKVLRIFVVLKYHLRRVSFIAFKTGECRSCTSLKSRACHKCCRWAI